MNTYLAYRIERDTYAPVRIHVTAYRVGSGWETCATVPNDYAGARTIRTLLRAFRALGMTRDNQSERTDR